MFTSYVIQILMKIDRYQVLTTNFHKTIILENKYLFTIQIQIFN